MHAFCGNDILDINTAENIKSFTNPAYLTKVFTESELNYINSSKNRLISSYVFWACKESVYKLCFKSSQKAFSFFPKQFLITAEPFLQNSNSYLAVFKNKSYSVTVEISEEYIHTFCFDKSGPGNNNYYFDSDVRYDMFANQQNGSLKCREFIKEKLNSKYPYINIVEKEINGIILPGINVSGNPQSCSDISISHDGSWMAYSFIFVTEQ